MSSRYIIVLPENALTEEAIDRLIGSLSKAGAQNMKITTVEGAAPDLDKFLDADPTGAVILPTSNKPPQVPARHQIGDPVSVSFDRPDAPTSPKHLNVEGHVYAVRFTEGKVWYDVQTYTSDILLRDLDSACVFPNPALGERHGAPRRSFSR